jgi:hypothetical protein
VGTDLRAFGRIESVFKERAKDRGGHVGPIVFRGLVQNRQVFNPELDQVFRPNDEHVPVKVANLVVGVESPFCHLLEDVGNPTGKP